MLRKLQRSAKHRREAEFNAFLAAKLNFFVSALFKRCSAERTVPWFGGNRQFKPLMSRRYNAEANQFARDTL